MPRDRLCPLYSPGCGSQSHGDAPGTLFPRAVSPGCACSSAPAPSSPPGLCLGLSLPGTPSEAAVQGAGSSGDGGGAEEHRKEGKVLCEAVPGFVVDTAPQPLRDRAGRSPFPQHTRGWPDASVPKAGAAETPAPPAACPKAAHLTERENSPGVLSLSRTRKAPR